MALRTAIATWSVRVFLSRCLPVSRAPLVVRRAAHFSSTQQRSMSSDDNGQIDLILEYLYLGGRKGAKNRGLLRQRNIRHIINMTPPRNVDELAGCPNFFEKEKELTYLRCPIFDGISEDIAQHFDRCIAFIQKVRQVQ